MNLETPVHGASEIGHVKVGDKLMEYGADSSKIDESRKTPLLAVSKVNVFFKNLKIWTLRTSKQSTEFMKNSNLLNGSENPESATV